MSTTPYLVYETPDCHGVQPAVNGPWLVVSSDNSELHDGHTVLHTLN